MVQNFVVFADRAATIKNNGWRNNDVITNASVSTPFCAGERSTSIHDHRLGRGVDSKSRGNHPSLCSGTHAKGRASH